MHLIAILSGIVCLTVSVYATTAPLSVSNCGLTENICNPVSPALQIAVVLVTAILGAGFILLGVITQERP